MDRPAAILCKRKGMANGIGCTANECTESTGHRPLRDVPAEDVLLLHRHYMWANQQREAFFKLLENPSADALTPGPLMMATREMGFMFVWYGLLWAFTDRSLDIRGPFRQDINGMADLLRRCRNAVVQSLGVLPASRLRARAEADRSHLCWCLAPCVALRQLPPLSVIARSQTLNHTWRTLDV
jgi:hypothetical protein